MLMKFKVFLASWPALELSLASSLEENALAEDRTHNSWTRRALWRRCSKMPMSRWDNRDRNSITHLINVDSRRKRRFPSRTYFMAPFERSPRISIWDRHGAMNGLMNECKLNSDEPSSPSLSYTAICISHLIGGYYGNIHMLWRLGSGYWSGLHRNWHRIDAIKSFDIYVLCVTL